MNFRKILFAGATLCVALGLAAPALAATATTNVNVRATPGGTVVDVMRDGERADIVGRSGGWCEVDRRGPDGWVACRYLAGSDSVGNDDSDASVSFGVGNSGQPSISFSVPGFSFSIGDGGFDRPRPDRPSNRRGDVCFYEDVNYGGDRFCVREGERLRALGQWNDRISSIRVRNGAEALVCEDNGFRGRCVVIDRDVRNLGRRGNDIISSIRVR